jgi:hypothetical protein
MNYDANAIEIVNKQLVPVYQVIYKRPDVLNIYGQFLANHVYAVTSNGMVEGNKFVPSTSLGLQRIFRYPASAHPDQRVVRND